MLPKIPIIRLPDSLDLPLPGYADGVSTTMTLVAAISTTIQIEPLAVEVVKTGFMFTLPLGIEAQIRSLKDYSAENGLVVLNAPATIDASHEGEMKVALQNMGKQSIMLRRGQPIASLVFAPVLRVVWDEVKTKMSTGRAKIALATEKETSDAGQPEVPEISLPTSEFSNDEIKQMQDEADNALKVLSDVDVNQVPEQYTEEALLEPKAPEPIAGEEDLKPFAPPSPDALFKVPEPTVEAPTIPPIEEEEV